jgi:hypothetical protein
MTILRVPDALFVCLLPASSLPRSNIILAILSFCLLLLSILHVNHEDLQFSCSLLASCIR